MDKKILIIEDDAVLLTALQSKFSVEGAEIVTNNGNSEINEIINIIILHKPDFIILDLILPKIDGFELLKKIKENNDISNIPVFIFTNMSDQDSKARCDQLGANYYFLKTELNIDELVEKIKKIFINKEKINPQ